MFLSYELKNKLDETVFDIAEEYNVKDRKDIMVVTDKDKYENTQYENVRMAIVNTKRMKSADYHYNNSDKLYDEYGNSIVDYYERLERVDTEIVYSPIDNVIKVYEIGYTGDKGNIGNVVRHLKQTIEVKTKKK